MAARRSRAPGDECPLRSPPGPSGKRLCEFPQPHGAVGHSPRLCSDGSGAFVWLKVYIQSKEKAQKGWVGFNELLNLELRGQPTWGFPPKSCGGWYGAAESRSAAAPSFTFCIVPHNIADHSRRLWIYCSWEPEWEL